MSLPHPKALLRRIVIKNKKKAKKLEEGTERHVYCINLEDVYDHHKYHKMFLYFK